VIRTQSTLRALIATVSFAAAILAHRHAAANIVLTKHDDWELSVDGRLNGFVSYAQGDRTPNGVAEWTAGLFEPPDPNTGEISVVRVRSGFVQNVLGFNVVKEAAPGYRLVGRFALWVGASNERKPVLGQPPTVEAREAYLRLEAPWGAIQAGRALGLFGRGGILMDYDIVHANGLGNPCSTRTILGGACGFAGHGVLFPAFNAGVLYNTPSFAGLQLTVGLFDPSVNSERAYEITPYPRLEAQISYSLRSVLKVFGEAMWQRLINTNPILDAMGNPVLDASGNPMRQSADASGVSAGASLSVGPLQVGGSFYQGTGLTLIVPIFNTPIFADQNNILRKGLGYVGMASLTFGGTKIAGGAGVSQLKLTSAEMEPYSQIVPPKQQLGISIGLYQTFFKQLTWAIEYFRGQYTWYQYQQTPASPIVSPKQNINFFNTGLTLVF
jgi:porin-like protein